MLATVLGKPYKNRKILKVNRRPKGGSLVSTPVGSLGTPVIPDSPGSLVNLAIRPSRPSRRSLHSLHNRLRR